MYTLYCGIASVPIFYGVKEQDVTTITECLADCDVDPDCGAAFLVNAVCYYSEQPTSYGPTDDPEAILAVRAAAPDPYPDATTSSTSSELPPIYEVPTT